MHWDSVFSALRDVGYDAAPLAFISLAVPKIVVEYKEQKADGSLGAPVTNVFDLRTGEKT